MCLAIPGKIIGVEGDGPITRTGTVDFGGVRKTVNLSFVPEAGVGDYVLVHVGFALSIIDQEEAERTLEYFEEMGGIDDAGEAGR